MKDDELDFVCEKCVHYEVCDRSSRMIWARLSKEKVCTDFMELVRCNDCKWYTLKKNVAYNGHFCDKIIEFVKPDDFCSYGERRTDG